MKATLIVLVSAAPILAAVVGTYSGEYIAANPSITPVVRGSSSDARWSEQVLEIAHYCRWLQADVTETQCLIDLGAAI